MSHQIHKTTDGVKLPKGIKGHQVITVYSVTSKVKVEGYSGKIVIISSYQEALNIANGQLVLCRTNLKVWAEIRN